jgi:hypothetical protein
MYRIASSQTIQIGESRMDRKTFEVTFKNESLTLPFKEFELLFKLARRCCCQTIPAATEVSLSKSKPVFWI